MTEKERKISNKSINKFKIFDAYEGVIDISQKNFRLNQTQPLKVPNTIFLVLFGFCLSFCLVFKHKACSQQFAFVCLPVFSFIVIIKVTVGQFTFQPLCVGGSPSPSSDLRLPKGGSL